MKAMVIIRRSPARRYLVELHTNKVRSEFKKLIAKRRNSQAMVLAFTRGKFQKEVSEVEAFNTKVDLILTENNACWDLSK
jgi:hypothetical protein